MGQAVCKENGFRPKFFADSNNGAFVPQEIQDIVQRSWEHNISKRYSISKAYNELVRYCCSNFQNYPHCSNKQHYHQQPITQQSQRRCKSVLSPKQEVIYRQKPLSRFFSSARNILMKNLAKKQARREDHQMESITFHSIYSTRDDCSC